jgi:hypothetical protein
VNAALTRDRPRRAPLWLLGLCGFLWADTALSLARRAGRWETAAEARRGSEEAQPALTEAGPRELRRLPGIGERRALDFARLRWERSGGELRLSEVPGIGPKTERALGAHGAAPQRLLGE